MRTRRGAKESTNRKRRTNLHVHRFPIYRNAREVYSSLLPLAQFGSGVPDVIRTLSLYIHMYAWRSIRSASGSKKHTSSGCSLNFTLNEFNIIVFYPKWFISPMVPVNSLLTFCLGSLWLKLLPCSFRVRLSIWQCSIIAAFHFFICDYLDSVIYFLVPLFSSLKATKQLSIFLESFRDPNSPTLSVWSGWKTF